MLNSGFNYLRSFFTTAEADEDKEEDLIAREIEEHKLLKDTKFLKGIGVLLNADAETCSISGEFDFKRNQFFGTFSKVKDQDEVIFEAKKCSTDNNWIVTSVERFEDSLAGKERRRLQVFVTIVEQSDRRNDFIIVKGGLDKEVSREVDRRLINFKPVRGDYLRLTLRFDGIIVREGEYVPHRVTGIPEVAEPTKQSTFKGTVTRKHNCLCIDAFNEIYFEDQVVEGNVKLGISDEVSGTAIESKQGPFSWRAINLKRLNRGRNGNNNRIPARWGDEEESVENSLSQEQFKTKNGVSIYPEQCLVFRSTEVNEISFSTLKIKVGNIHSKPILKNVYVVGDQNACYFGVEIDRNNNDFIHNFENESEYSIEITCTPKVIGRTKDFIKFEFDTFHCIRILKVLALPAKNASISDDFQNPSLPHQSRKNEKLSEKDTIQKMEQSSMIKAISGINPFRQPFFQIRKLPYYNIPENLLIALKTKDNNVMSMHYSVAQEPLTIKNFIDKFDLCLWLEEISVNVQLRQYDIRVRMNRCGDLFKLPLVNYPDITSLLHCGDKLRVTIPDPGENSGEKVYLGFIKDVKETNLFVAFDENLRYKYDNEIVKVDLLISRCRYQCNHFAVESTVKYLGESFLFPSEKHLVLETAKILFEEDTNNEEKTEDPSTSNTVLENPFRVKGLDKPVLGTLDSRWNSRGKSLRPIGPYRNIDTKPNGIVLKWADRSLNEEQKNAVRRILRGQARPLPYIIFGPPGTGKTVTVVEAIIQLYSLDPNTRILVTAPSNSAADLIAEKLIASGCFGSGDFVRLLGYVRAEHGKYSEELIPFLRTADELDLVAKHRVVISTTSSAGKFTQIRLADGHFTHVFIDEAGYCHEPEALLPCILVTFNRGGQVILAGDPNQLGPVIMSKYASMCGLSMSFLERLMTLPIYSRDEKKFPIEKYNPLLITKLVKNYRAHSMLLKIPSKLFYEDELEPCAHEEMYDLCRDERFLQAKILAKLNVPLVFRGIQGTSGRRSGLKTWFNEFEAMLVVEYVKKLLHLGIDKEDIGIITPYAGQVNEIKFQYRRRDDPEKEYNGPKVGSVEEFQGGERKVILYSTVRSASSEKELKTNDFTFVLNAKRFNVSITRPKSLLIVIGNPHVLVKDKNWSQLIEYAVEIGGYLGCDLPLELDKKTQNVIKSVP